MRRADIRIVDNQTEEIKPADISQTEKEALLAKYGFQSQPTNFNQPLKNDPNAGLSFEEMCRREEQKLQEQRFREHQRRTGPKPVSFDGDYYSNVNYDSDVDSGLTFKVSIVSNMEIPK